MKLTLALSFFVVCSVSDAWFTRNSHSDPSVGSLFNKLFQSVRPFTPPIAEAPVEDVVLETVEASENLPHVPRHHDFEHEHRRTVEKEPEYLPTRPKPTTKTVEHTVKDKVNNGLKQEIQGLVSQVIDIFLSVIHKRFLTFISVILPILGNVIDIASVYFKNRSF